MLINENFPIDINHFFRQDQTLSFAGMTWKDYEKFDTEKYHSYRISFLDGVITVVSPSQNHETIKDFIFLLIVAYCDAFGVDYYPTGSTTFKDYKKQVGKEPDTSFCFNNLQTIPDLAVEVVFSSGGTDDLEKYQRLGVKEVWFWIKNELQIYVLVDGIYQKRSRSLHLAKLEVDLLTKYISQAVSGNPRILKQSFLDEIN